MIFLAKLLKTAMLVSASSIYRANLKKGIGMHAADQVILEDILIAAGNGAGVNSRGTERAGHNNGM